MDWKARTTLELAVNQLESRTQGDPKEWIDSSTAELTTEQVLRYSVILSSLQGLYKAIGETIYGTNILTPALTHKGWMFWRKLPVTENEKEAINAAGLRAATCMQEVARASAELQNSTPEEIVAVIANLYTCYRQFAKDLREVLNTSPTGFENLRSALQGKSPDAETQEPDVEGFSGIIKNELAALALAVSPVDFGERARNVHALAKVQADALVEKINTLSEGSPLAKPSTSALAELVFTMSQAEVYAFKSNPFMFAGAPGNVQASWLNLVKATVHNEARALERALGVFRQLHGLEPQDTQSP